MCEVVMSISKYTVDWHQGIMQTAAPQQWVQHVHLRVWRLETYHKPPLFTLCYWAVANTDFHQQVGISLKMNEDEWSWWPRSKCSEQCGIHRIEQAQRGDGFVLVYSYFAGEYATFQAPQNPSSVLNDCSQKEERDSQEHNCSHGKSILLPYSFQQLFSFVQLSSQVLAPTDSLFLYIHNKLSMCCSLTIIKPNTTFCTIHLQSTNLQSTNQTLTN